MFNCINSSGSSGNKWDGFKPDSMPFALPDEKRYGKTNGEFYYEQLKECNFLQLLPESWFKQKEVYLN